MSGTPAAAYELWRQDDHGRHYLVGRHATLGEAERRLAALTRTPHKQFYWIVQTGLLPHHARGNDDRSHY